MSDREGPTVVKCRGCKGVITIPAGEQLDVPVCPACREILAAMGKPEAPSHEFVKDATLLRGDLMGVTACVVAADRVIGLRISHALAAGDEASVARIRGNRSGTYPVGWADLRRLMIGTLKLCLAELEKAEAEG